MARVCTATGWQRLPIMRFPILAVSAIAALSAGCHTRTFQRFQRLPPSVAPCAGPRVLPPATWQSAGESGAFLFQLPPDYRADTVAGTHGLLLRWRSQAAYIAYEYGPYVEPRSVIEAPSPLLHDPDPPASFFACIDTINGQPVALTTLHRLGYAQPYLAYAHWQTPSGAPFYVSIRTATVKEQQKALQILRSVQLLTRLGRAI